MNTKQLNIVLGVVVVILLAIIGYMALRLNSQNDALVKPEAAVTNNLPDNGTNGSKSSNNTNTQQNTQTSNSKPSVNAQTPQVQLPVVAFIPDVFSDNEKQQIRTRLLNPYVDWNKEEADPGNQYVSISVERTDSLDYKYSIRTIANNGGWGGFLYGNDQQADIPLWTPDCMGKCTFSEAFKKKYPEVFNEYNKKNP